MDSVFDFLNQPIILTLITLTVGSFLLSLVAERRARNDKLRDKAIEFLTDAGDIISQFVPHVYGQLRTGSTNVDDALRIAIKDLFAKRLGIQVGSQAYLRSETFLSQYYQLLDQLMAVVVCMTELEQGGNTEETLLKIQEHSRRLGDSWPLADESLPPSTGRPVDELILWMDMILHRAAQLLSKHLKAALH